MTIKTCFIDIDDMNGGIFSPNFRPGFIFFADVFAQIAATLRDSSFH